jgi:U4/U6.U5 tri-snRNP-associated protein 3
MGFLTDHKHQAADYHRDDQHRRSASPPSSRNDHAAETSLPTRSHPSNKNSNKRSRARSRDRSANDDDMDVGESHRGEEERGRGGRGGGSGGEEGEEGEVDDDDDMAAMQAMMGFGDFGSTKGKKVAGNDVGVVRKEKKREYRQYMNRQGGFNRPLSPTR